MLLKLFYLLGVHAIADFALQSLTIGVYKNRHRKVNPADIPPGQTPQTVWPYFLSSHAMTHAVGVALVTGNVWLGIAEFVAHWIIDFGKCENWYGIHVDQSMHIVCKIAWWLIWLKI